MELLRWCDGSSYYRPWRNHHADAFSCCLPEGTFIPHSYEMPSFSTEMVLQCTPDEWRDSSKFNGYFFRAAFPSINIETSRDWDDRIFMTRDGNSAFLFESVLFSDRSASFRGDNCGKNHRIASEAYEYVRGRASKWWWEPGMSSLPSCLEPRLISVLSAQGCVDIRWRARIRP